MNCICSSSTAFAHRNHDGRGLSPPHAGRPRVTGGRSLRVCGSRLSRPQERLRRQGSPERACACAHGSQRAHKISSAVTAAAGPICQARLPARAAAAAGRGLGGPAAAVTSRRRRRGRCRQTPASGLPGGPRAWPPSHGAGSAIRVVTRGAPADRQRLRLGLGPGMASSRHGPGPGPDGHQCDPASRRDAAGEGPRPAI